MKIDKYFYWYYYDDYLQIDQYIYDYYDDLDYYKNVVGEVSGGLNFEFLVVDGMDMDGYRVFYNNFILQ